MQGRFRAGKMRHSSHQHPESIAMSHALACPHCRNLVSADGAQPDQVIACRSCGGSLRVPAVVVVQPSPVLINTAAKAPPRLKPAGWFSRSFGSAAGVLLAVVLILGVVAAVMCGGLFWAGTKGVNAVAVVANKAADASRDRTAMAIKHARPVLDELGVVELAEDAEFADLFGSQQLVGKGRMADGRVVDVAVFFSVGKFGHGESWQVQRVMVDRRIVFDSSRKK